MSKAFGFFAGGVIGTLLFLVLRLVLGLGLTVVPVSELLLELLPGFIVGCLLGYKFHRTVGRAVDFFWITGE